MQSIPKDFLPNNAIEENHVINYKGVITNINLIFEFDKSCKESKTSKLIYTYYNENNEPTIKTILYTHGKFFVNVDNTRTSNGNNVIKSYQFDDYEIVDDKEKLTIFFQNSTDKIDFLIYNKKTGEGN